MVALTIGMPTYKDFDGVYFTIQSLRLYHDLEDTELLVVDNFGCEYTKRFVEGSTNARYVLATDAVGTAAAKNVVFQEASGEAVLCCDSHILFVPGAIARLKEYYRTHPDCADLLQGPTIHDDLLNISTHLDPVWRGQFWGTWATDPRGADLDGEPFEIPMQGMGVFTCRKDAWPGFNPRFRGFGGEEGYIQEKFRQAGGRCLCLPWLRWAHRFSRPAGVPYPLSVEDKLRNFVIGHTELGLDPAPILEHFREHLAEDRIVAVAVEALWGPQAGGPEAAPGANGGAVGKDAVPASSAAVRQHRSATQRVFTEIHDKNLWRAASVSGPGSTRRETALVRERLEALFQELEIRTLCDAACGDASWITKVTGGLDLYFGFDIVEALVSRNLSRYAKSNHFFRVADVSSDVLPKADAILCRDLLGHLPLQQGVAALENFKRSGAKYLIATTFPSVAENGEPGLGGWCPLNLTVAPFNLPPPIRSLRERHPNPDDPFNDKSLGVWCLADDPVAGPLDGTQAIDADGLATLAYERARLGAAWLAAVVRPDGSFPYFYHPDRDEFDTAHYNEVRHAGTTYALFQAYGVTEEEPVRTAAEAASRFIDASSRPAAVGGRAYVYGDVCKLGGQALALVALLERRRVTRDATLDGLIADLATFLLRMELAEEPGRFYMSYDAATDQRLLTPPSDYYPGEALLALTRLAQQFPDGPYLAAAVRLANYLVRRRDGDIVAQGQIPREDHWLAIGLSELFRLDRNPDFATVAYLQADSMLANQYPTDDSDWRRIGGARRPGPINYTSTATKGEAMLAVWDLATLREDATAVERFSTGARRTAQFQMRAQFTTENTHHFPRPDRVAGAWGQDATNPRIRLDFVQHNVSALIGVWQMTREGHLPIARPLA